MTREFTEYPVYCPWLHRYKHCIHKGDCKTCPLKTYKEEEYEYNYEPPGELIETISIGYTLENMSVHVYREDNNQLWIRAVAASFIGQWGYNKSMPLKLPKDVVRFSQTDIEKVPFVTVVLTDGRRGLLDLRSGLVIRRGEEITIRSGGNWIEVDGKSNPNCMLLEEIKESNQERRSLYWQRSKELYPENYKYKHATCRGCGKKVVNIDMRRATFICGECKKIKRSR